jgi:membrane dipeptidase
MRATAYALPSCDAIPNWTYGDPGRESEMTRFSHQMSPAWLLTAATRRIRVPGMLLLVLILTGTPGSLAGGDHSTAALRKRVEKALRQAPLIDGHNDLPWQFTRMGIDVDDLDLRQDTSNIPDPLLTDIPRLRAGLVGAQFWSVYVPANAPVFAAGQPATVNSDSNILAAPELGRLREVYAALVQFDVVHRMVNRYPDDFELARTAADIRRIHRQGRIASLIGLEGGHFINNSLPLLRMYYALGARYMTLTHVETHDWADAAGDEPRHHGLTEFGREVVLEMNRLGMLVDLSHVTDDVMRDALATTRAPVIFSHSSARALCDHPRNVPDDVLGMIRTNRGVVMVCFLPGCLNEPNRNHFVRATAYRRELESRWPGDPARIAREMKAWRFANPAPPATVSDVADHIDHVRKVAGIDAVGIGSDFEGYLGVVEGLEDVSGYPALFMELARRGYSRKALQKIAGLNFLRAFREAEKVAERSR